MSEHPTAEQKQHMIDLIKEITAIKNNIFNIRKKSMLERKTIAERMKQIEYEMREYVKRYPND